MGDVYDLRRAVASGVRGGEHSWRSSERDEVELSLDVARDLP